MIYSRKVIVVMGLVIGSVRSGGCDVPAKRLRSIVSPIVMKICRRSNMDTAFCLRVFLIWKVYESHIKDTEIRINA